MRLINAIKRRLFPPSETLEGYEQPELVDVIFRKTVAYRPTEPWPEMEGASTVLDFGGGCGLHYKQMNSKDVRWAVVETRAMVNRAKELATDRLQFFTAISDAAEWLGHPIDVMHSSGALQYTEDPLNVLGELCSLRAAKMYWQRVLFSSGNIETNVQSSFLGDNGPGSLSVKEKVVQYPRTAIPEQRFLDAHELYSLESRGSDWFRFELARQV